MIDGHVIYLPHPRGLGEWLEALRLSRYAEALAPLEPPRRRVVCASPSESIASRSLADRIAGLTDEQLRELGVAHRGHRKRLLIAASKIILATQDTLSSSSDYLQTMASSEGSDIVVGVAANKCGSSRTARARGLLTMLRVRLQSSSHLFAAAIALGAALYRIVVQGKNPNAAVIVIPATLVAINARALVVHRCMCMLAIIHPLAGSCTLIGRLIRHPAIDDLLKLSCALSSVIIVITGSYHPLWTVDDRSDAVDERFIWHRIRRDMARVCIVLSATNVLLYAIHTVAPDACAAPATYWPDDVSLTDAIAFVGFVAIFAAIATEDNRQRLASLWLVPLSDLPETELLDRASRRKRD